MTQRGGKVVLASDNDWLTEALTAVLRTHLYGLEIDVTRDREQLQASVLRRRPNLVIADERLGRDTGVAGLCRELAEGSPGRPVPLLLYSSGGPNPELEADALAAGAWGVLHEPLRSEVLTAKVDRFLEIDASLRRSQLASCVDEATGLFEFQCLLETIPTMAALARRRRTPMSCTVVGPTRDDGTARDADRLRRTVRTCVKNVRGSDLSGWADGGAEVAIVAFDAPAEGAEVLVRRLNALVRREDAGEEEYPLSAGIVEIASGAEETGDVAEASEALAAARSALEEARAAGGGIRVAAVA